jgi:hypothetical protein
MEKGCYVAVPIKDHGQGEAEGPFHGAGHEASVASGRAGCLE